MGGISRRASSQDKRSIRSQHLLRDALAEELKSGVELSHVTVAALTQRAGLTRRTFYSHYSEIAEFIQAIEDDIIGHLRQLFSNISTRTLVEVYESINKHEPCPGSVELLTYCKENASLLAPLMGAAGDPRFTRRIHELSCAVLHDRMLDGLTIPALEPFFDYYLISFVSAETGIVRSWLANGCKESPEMLARLMTVIAFIRPGDLYGEPIDINVPEYERILLGLNSIASNIDPQGTKSPSARLAPIIERSVASTSKHASACPNNLVHVNNSDSE